MMVVHRSQIHSTSPAPNAKGVYAAPHGDDYSYYVEEYVKVVAVLPEGKLIVCTRYGTQRALCAEDPMLRRATWWERLLFRKLFKLFPPYTDIIGHTQPEGETIEGAALSIQ